MYGGEPCPLLLTKGEDFLMTDFSLENKRARNWKGLPGNWKNSKGLSVAHKDLAITKQVGHYQSKKHAEHSELSSRMLPWKEQETQNKTSKQAEEPDSKNTPIFSLYLLV